MKKCWESLEGALSNRYDPTYRLPPQNLLISTAQSERWPLLIPVPADVQSIMNCRSHLLPELSASFTVKFKSEVLPI
jgi:hypothetical protein